jgi:hypothetical protein
VAISQQFLLTRQVLDFIRQEILLTPAYNFQNTKASYFGRTEKDKNVLSFGTSGVVFGSGWNRGLKKRGGGSHWLLIKRPILTAISFTAV